MKRPSLRAVLCTARASLLSALPNSTEFVGALAAGDTAGAREKVKGWIYSGYKMTIFSMAEEQQRSRLRLGGKRSLSTRTSPCRRRAVTLVVAAPCASYVLQDRELISGQNPFSDQALLKLLLPALSGKRSEGASTHNPSDRVFATNAATTCINRVKKFPQRFRRVVRRSSAIDEALAEM